ncbi:uncharacterized protein LOC124456116 [Xenia sp. Carnegie-2017]|uniref:uncharacterized protein LOC124456116 n=1 Tax=Xenia sp. Carnegie-2017 TaxID=2897299 RepID=UPI001F042E1E|nr:uncharacterized protein LOC124456116 [Xenia sp. Carnegie-2017]
MNADNFLKHSSNKHNGMAKSQDVVEASQTTLHFSKILPTAPVTCDSSDEMHEGEVKSVKQKFCNDTDISQKKNLEVALEVHNVCEEIFEIDNKINERSFSKMKIVKNYLRSTMKGERLEELIVLSTEKDLTDTIHLDVVLKSWAARKNRKLRIKFK